MKREAAPVALVTAVDCGSQPQGRVKFHIAAQIEAAFVTSVEAHMKVAIIEIEETNRRCVFCCSHCLEKKNLM